jgi:predicted short-subunit dehydrogenase-like oxidoreductase (DUF2520 family)
MGLKITVIGSGNVGFHLAQRLYECGYSICQVFSRTPTKSAHLAKLVKSNGISNLRDISLEADVYILAIHDDGIKIVTEEINFLGKYNKVIAHTSGSVSSSIFETHFNNYGIFYPLQTFSTTKKVDFERLPFCIYGNNTSTQEILFQLAQSICPNVYLITDEQRAILHVTAVIVNNFSNYLYGIAHDICTDQNVPFDILKPLIYETVRKIDLSNPQDVQTGPAVRGDLDTIAKHIEFLKKYPDHQALYELISSGIINQIKQRALVDKIDK